ncbi:MAG: hypothetical protein KKD73_12090 [Proteobacteria bacterium]|nr:hypothetical protein [Pseudomonadota bacterium]MBU1640781.1 hypothetical protein [Pseudomonadota bacterium]
MEVIQMLWSGLALPLMKLIFFVSLGLAFANFIESLNWTHKIASLSKPLIRLGHLSSDTGASFSMAFFSGVSSNSMLAEAFDQKRIDKKELICANLFNSLPTYFLHLPTMFFITAPLIKGAALIYVSITFIAAMLRTFIILVVGHFLLEKKKYESSEVAEEKRLTVREALVKTWQRFRNRLKKIVLFTVPIYTVIFIINKSGGFDVLEDFMATHLSILSWLHPQSLGIIVLHLAAEFTAGLAVAGALLDAGTMSYREIVLALLVGNILSSPVRAVRHQFPYYAGIFSPRIAMELILYNQGFRIGSLVAVSLGYYLFF